jgi:hypothetical protein
MAKDSPPVYDKRKSEVYDSFVPPSEALPRWLYFREGITLIGSELHMRKASPGLQEPVCRSAARAFK